jgi:hypothetical protein
MASIIQAFFMICMVAVGAPMLSSRLEWRSRGILFLMFLAFAAAFAGMYYFTDRIEFWRLTR